MQYLFWEGLITISTLSLHHAPYLKHVYEYFVSLGLKGCASHISSKQEKLTQLFWCWASVVDDRPSLKAALGQYYLIGELRLFNPGDEQ